MDHRLRNILVTGAFALLANIFFYQPAGSGMLSLGAIGLFCLITIVYAQTFRTHTHTRTMITYGTLVLTFAGLASYRGSCVAQFLLYGGAFGAVLLYLYSRAIGIAVIRSLMELLFVPFSIIGAYLSAGIEGILHSSEAPKLLGITKKTSAGVVATILGILLGLPIIGILLWLLMSADPIFATVIRNAGNFFTFGNIPTRVILTLGVFIVLAPLGFLKIKQDFTSPSQLFTKFQYEHSITVVLAMVSAVLGMFLFVQWPYIFVRVAGETDLTKFGITTYSEYVKRGFTELLLISALVYGLLWAGILTLRGRTISKANIPTMIQMLLFTEFAVFILSVARRIKLYWDFHGLTLVRVYGGIFLIGIALLTLTLLLRLWIRQKIVRLEMAIVCMLLFVVGFGNAEQFIIYHHPPTVNGQIDFVYLARLSADGYDGWKQAYAHAEKTLNNPQHQNGLITKEQRRDIAYAGLTVGILTGKYHKLIYTYGTTTERKEYLNTIFDQELSRINLFLPQIEADLSLIQQKGNTVQASWDGIFIPAFTREGRSSYIQETRDILRQSSKVISESLHNISASSTGSAVTLAHLNPVSPGKLVHFVNGPCRLEFSNQTMATQWCLPSFYVVFPHGQDQVDVPSVVSRLTRWNGSDERAYRNFRQDIPFNSLIQLQEQYLKLYQRILTQSDNEKDYPLDIALDVPFLAPIH